MTALEDFMSDCQPAGFGFQGEEKYDENVRRAWAMDASRFATNVCPYALGIVDRIEQLLLPNVDGIGRGGVKDGGYIRAERYKINVYKGPSDFFKSHIDTPRAKNQFGSLVLCLPSKHKGGQLIVNHVGSSIRYDWDKTQASQALQWAALYSDCEHEVLEVTSGYRVTLTFNLYYEPRASRGGDPLSGLRSKPAPVDITSLAPYGVLQELLQDQEWMTNGGNLGIYCAHAYPTTTSNVKDVYPRQSDPPPDPLPSDAITALKGTDASIYAVLYFLGLNVSLKPVIQKPETGPLKYHEDDEFPLEVASVEPGMVMTSREVYKDSDELVYDIGEKLDPVVWVNTALWKSLAFIHGYEGNEPEPPGITYSYMSLVAAIPPAAERINKPKRQKKGRDN
ncbi:hypothetical protein F5883DRAFT_230388 [Neofusicoccum parvum]|uniref:Uncharacterized protein n=1 Tax=Neofusicoccum parvum TaxID=310453 RepID=A0ACB5SEE4_9PEZI|nr:hypothetical protein F5883DRAFT_230388 [Neofusicoccum parvum]